MDIVTDVRGSAVHLDNSYCTIICCDIRNCWTKLEGGGIYLSDSQAHINNNIFTNCTIYDLPQTETKHGNAMNLMNTDLNMAHCSFYLCGPAIKQCSDSCVITVNKLIKVKYSNCSYNCGFNGATFVSIRTCDPNTIVKYCECSYGRGDMDNIEAIDCNYTASHLNFVDSTGLNDILWVTKDFSISESIFINSNKSYNGGGIVNFVNYFSNVEM